MSRKTTAVVGMLAVLAVIASWKIVEFKQSASTEPTTTNSDMLVDADALPVTSEEVQYTGAAKGLYAYPEVDGEYPGVIMIHEWWGLNDHIKEMAHLLAGQGYRVLAVDLYNGNVATTREEAQQYRNALVPEEAIANMKDASAFLRERGATKMASLGWCFGGGQSLQFSLSGEPLDATVIYYGNLVTDQAQLASLNSPVLGIFGAEDTGIPVDQVNEFDAALDAANIENDINIYPGVGHAFANPSGANYAPEQTKDAWAKTLAFLQEHLK